MLLANIIGMPIINVRFAMLEPIAFPKTRAGAFLKAALIATNSSGSVVANAITIEAITNSLNLKNTANLLKDFTTQEPDLARKMHATINHNI